MNTYTNIKELKTFVQNPIYKPTRSKEETK